MTGVRKAVVPVLTEVLQVPSAPEATPLDLKQDAAVAPAAVDAPVSRGASTATPYRETPADLVERISLFDDGSSLDVELDIAERPSSVNAASAVLGQGTGTATLGASASGVQAEQALVERILVDVQRQLDLMIEHQLTAALEPSIQRLTQTLALEARQALWASLSDVVRRSVRQEIERIRASS